MGEILTKLNVVDPVCGMTVDPNRDPKPTQYTYGGETYLFCCQSCATKFEANPDEYLANGPDTPAPLATIHTTGYICPMDPEEWSETPGSCSICGMALEPANPLDAGDDNPELDDMTQRLWVAAVFTFPVFIMAMAADIPGLGDFFDAEWSHWLQCIFATPVVLWAGGPFFKRGWRSLYPLHPNMFTLIALGTGAAYLFSVLAHFVPHIFPDGFKNVDGQLSLYFEAAAVIITLVLLGQILELRARGKTGAALRMLLDLSPKTAKRLSSSGIETEVPLTEVKIDDILRAHPGENIPTDGIVLEGTSAVDESMITGEAVPTVKSNGDKVVGGTMNGLGALTIRVETVGTKTMLARIAAMVGEAQRSRAPVQRIADRVAGFFVPIVVAAAVMAFIAWSIWGPEPALAYALIAAVSVLIIACPCALGLATPMSIMVAMGQGAKAGALIRNAEVLERLGVADTVVLDKTGTLTEGTPSLRQVTTFEPFAEREILGMAASLEQNSEHPLALAFINAAQARGSDLTSVVDFASITGLGVSGKIAGQALLLGNAALMRQNEVDIAVRNSQIEPLQQNGSTIVYLAIGGNLAGVFSINDEIRPSAAQSVKDLHRTGLKVVMLTGDTRKAADAVATTLGIEDVHAEASPEDKLQLIKHLRAEGRVVAMVGDGINDAPALAKADIGIAMGNGTDIAIESADVALLQGNLEALLRARRLSTATMRNIRQNLFFAFIYNAIGIPIAAGVLYPLFGIFLSPMIAAAAMSLSSISVIGNALRLRATKL